MKVRSDPWLLVGLLLSILLGAYNTIMEWRARTERAPSPPSVNSEILWTSWGDRSGNLEKSGQISPLF